MIRFLKNQQVKKCVRAAVEWVDIYRTWQQFHLKRVAPLARGRLLDVGCGQMPYKALLEPFVTEYVGVELRETFEQTHASTAVNKPDLYYDGLTLPFEDNSFDTVFNLDVLEHTPNPALLVKEMGRVLKEDGLLILAAPFSFRLHELPHDYFRYSPEGLRVLCTEAGLEITEIKAYGSLWSVLAHKLNSYLAFQLGRFMSVGQICGKCSHESTRTTPPRLRMLPVIIPLMCGSTAAAKILDRIAPDPTETLAHLLVARRRKEENRS